MPFFDLTVVSAAFCCVADLFPNLSVFVFFCTPIHSSTQIEYYGGYENVARRLHLGYHYEDELQYQEKVRDELKLQNEMYGKVRERNLEKQRNKLAKLKVRLQMKRMNFERERKLADGLRQRKAEDEEDSGPGRRR